jgi:hypothetical protein
MKQRLLDLIKPHLAAVLELQNRVRRYTGRQVQAQALLLGVRELASGWFDSVKPALQSANFDADLSGKMSDTFEGLLRLSKTRPAKTILMAALTDCVRLYKDEILHRIEIGDFSPTTGLSIAPYIEGLETDEGEYLAEAQRCLSVNGLRACIILGWRAIIARIHTKIAEMGFDIFSQATSEMFAKTTGRFKPFKKDSIFHLCQSCRRFSTPISCGC